MSANSINCISPIDGRYYKATLPLSHYFSEKALIRYRLLVEIAYFEALCKTVPELQGIENERLKALQTILEKFHEEDALLIKEIEKTTNHDIKAVEYFLKKKFESLGLAGYQEFVHFGLTSQDINNTALPLMIRDGLAQVIFPAMENMLSVLLGMAKIWKDVPMLARTHGQPASPTSLGKEILVFHARLQEQCSQLKACKIPAKFGGATGNFNAHHLAYPHIDWNRFANDLLQGLGLTRSYPTTQIDHYDNLATIFDNLKRICTIIIDLNRDFWTYISMDYFSQKVVEGEVGSSAMPHKVNPIDFENSEGNAGIAIALFEHFSSKLPISRLQRDLTDSTVSRNIGVAFAHLFISINSTLRGLSKISLNEPAILKDLENNPAVIAEAIQTILRKINYPQPYEKLKDLTRGDQKITLDAISRFIDSLEIPEDLKADLKKITPFNYIGIAPHGLK